MNGLVHIYCGDGKGKTTAATGLAVRAAGAGKKVLFAQFLKQDTSSEIAALRRFGNVTVRHCSDVTGWVRDMTAGEREQAATVYDRFFAELAREAENYDLLVLDEAVVACGYGMLREPEILRFLDQRPESLEVVLTGRGPSEALLDRADYVTEMKKIKHPYDAGIRARAGIEY